MGIASHLDAGPLGASRDLDALATAITHDEVRHAMKRCQRGKAQGPDGLWNDWYRDHADKLVLLLTRHFRIWYRTRVVPESCLQATIYCLKKTATVSRQLEHWPTAPLNTDYKIYTRIFALQLRPRLPDLIHKNEAGFAPGRSIHTAIDVFHSAQKLARKEDPGSAAVVYSSTLQRHMTPSIGVHGRGGAEARFHTGIRQDGKSHSRGDDRSFPVNGYLLAPIKISYGARQGCPMAPMHFILAMNTLYLRLEFWSDISGVEVRSKAPTSNTCIAGYADETTLYLRDAQMTTAAMEDLGAFGAA